MKKNTAYHTKQRYTSTSGFTVVEIIAAAALLALVGFIFLSQKNTIEAINRDKERKTAINSIHYNLEEIVKQNVGGYPSKLDTKQLKAMDSALLKDPQGVVIGEKGSDYRYEATGCNGGMVCSGYTLTADLEREADYKKTNR